MMLTSPSHGRMAKLAALCCLAFCFVAADSAPCPAQQTPDLKQLQPGDGQPAAAQARLIGPLKGIPDWVTSLAFTPDGKQLAVGTYEQVQIWSVADKRVLTKFPVKGYARSVNYNPSGSLLAVGSYRAVTLWNTADSKVERTLDGHRAYVTGVAFSPDGKLLASSSEDETARLWNVAEGKEIRALGEHEYPVQAVAFSPDGALVATAAGDETRVTRPGPVTLWDAATGEKKFDLVEHEKVAVAVAFSPDGKYLVSGGVDEKCNVYETATGQALGYYAGQGRPANSVVFAHNSLTVISGGGGRAKGGNDVKIWNCTDGEELATLSGHQNKVTSVALASDGATLASGGIDNTVLLWDIAPVLPQPAAPAVAFADDQGPIEASQPPAAAAQRQTLRAGIIGLDTSHVIAFTKILNDPQAADDVAGCTIVAAYPKGSPDIESSTSRVPGYTAQLETMGVEIVDSIDALLEKVDVVFLETNDGRPHLEQVLPVLKAGKPVFIDKPIAGSLADAIAIFEAARKYNVKLFSSSSLRFTEGAQALRNGKIGDIVGCDAYSPASLEKTHPDLFWYGIHGVETLFTVMGPGCESVTRTSTPSLDLVVGKWSDDRIGSFRGIRRGKSGYGGTAFGTKGIEQIGSYGGYRPLLVEILKFFRTGEVPVAEQETLEIYAFMEAADESKRQGGVPVTLQSVIDAARPKAQARLQMLDP